jgi:membrane associated rhomboid family serine protease
LINVAFELLVGLPLEMSQGTWRVALVYLTGVAAGSLGSSCFEPSVNLAGASGGVYALISAHLATLILNWEEDTLILRRRIRSAKILGLEFQIKFAIPISKKIQSRFILWLLQTFN